MIDNNILDQDLPLRRNDKQKNVIIKVMALAILLNCIIGSIEPATGQRNIPLFGVDFNVIGSLFIAILVISTSIITRKINFITSPAVGYRVVVITGGLMFIIYILYAILITIIEWVMGIFVIEATYRHLWAAVIASLLSLPIAYINYKSINRKSLFIPVICLFAIV